MPEAKANVSGTAQWKDDNNSQNIRPDSYRLYLHVDGEYKGYRDFDSDVSNWSFGNFDKFNADTGNEIVYKVTAENKWATNNTDIYRATNSGTDFTFTLTGTNVLKMKKRWSDVGDKYNTRPDIITFIVRAYKRLI